MINRIFVIGHNKTGTTSMAHCLHNAGYRVAPQLRYETLHGHWAKRDFMTIAGEVMDSHAEVFQDVPFSLPFTYMAMDMAFPGSKFILTIRDEMAWLESLIRSHDNLLGLTPDASHEERWKAIQDCTYVYPGWLAEFYSWVWGINSPTDLEWRLESPRELYNDHNTAVLNYFRFRQSDLLVLDVSEPDANVKLANFLGRDPQEIVIPHLNRSK